MVGDRGDVELDGLGSLFRSEFGGTENDDVGDVNALESRGCEALRQGEAEERGGDSGVGDVENLSSG